MTPGTRHFYIENVLIVITPKRTHLTLHFKALPELTALKVSLADRSLCHHAPFCASARRLYHAYRLWGFFSEYDLETTLCYTMHVRGHYEDHQRTGVLTTNTHPTPAISPNPSPTRQDVSLCTSARRLRPLSADLTPT